jgi:hypothetical protein
MKRSGRSGDLPFVSPQEDSYHQISPITPSPVVPRRGTKGDEEIGEIK